MIRVLVTLIGVFCIIGTGTIACSDSDIVHPALCYQRVRECKTCPWDSILIGKVTYEPLPEYQKPSKMLIEWYCKEEITKDLNLRVEGPVWNYQLSRPLPVWRAPIHKGDTVRAELTITPLTVGIVDIRLYAGEPVMFPEGDSLVPREIPRANLRTFFVLGPDGQTTAMNSPATNQPYSTFLGPLPEVMAESLLFFRDPKFPADLAGPEPAALPAQPRFAIEGIVYTQADDSGYRKITCRVSPYYQFDAGIGFQINQSDDVVLKNASPSWLQPVFPQDTLEFSVWYRATQWGISRISLRFRTFNPDYGKADGPIGYPDYEEIGTNLLLFFGYDQDMRLLFITDEFPEGQKGTYDRAGAWIGSERWSIQKRMDSRVAWLDASQIVWKGWKSYSSEGFDKVMNYGRKPVEVVPMKHKW